MFPGEEEARRRRGWRPGVRAHRALPVGGGCRRRGWPEQARRRRTGSGGGGCSGRRRSSGLGGGRGVGELHGGEEKLARGSIGGEEGRGRGLRARSGVGDWIGV